MANPWDEYQVQSPFAGERLQVPEVPALPETEDVGFTEAIFPSSSKIDIPEGFGEVLDYAEDPFRFGLFAGDEQEKAGDIAGAGLHDLFSFTTRTLGALKQGLTQEAGEPGFMETMADPQAGLLKEERQKGAKFWDDIANNTTNPILKGLYKTMGVANQLGYGLLEDPISYFGLAKLFASKTPGFSRAGVPKEALEEGGFPLSPAQTGQAGGPAKAVETYAQANPFLEPIPEAIKARQRFKLEETISNVSRKMGGQDIKEAAQGGSVRGAIIEQKIKDWDNINSELFQNGEDFIQKKTGHKPVNMREVNIFTRSKKRLVDAQGQPIEHILTKMYKSNAMDKMESMMEQAGHKLGDEAKNIGNISKKTIKQAEIYYKDIAEARTIGDLLNVKRNIADEVFDNVNKGFLTGDKNIGFLRSINKELNDALEESITAVSPGVGGEQIAGVFRSMNEQFASNLDALMMTNKKLGIGRADIRFEDVIGKIKLIGTKNLRELQEAARTKLEVRPIYEEIQRGAYEDLIAKSLNRKTMEISPDKLATAWNSMDNGLKEAIFPQQIIGETNKLVKTIQKIYAGDIVKMNPSGTVRGLTSINSISDVKSWVNAVLSYPVIKRYYKTGKLPHQSIWNLITGPDGKFYLTTGVADKIMKAESLGNFIRSAVKTDKKEDE